MTATGCDSFHRTTETDEECNNNPKITANCTAVLLINIDMEIPLTKQMGKSVCNNSFVSDIYKSYIQQKNYLDEAINSLISVPDFRVSTRPRLHIAMNIAYKI